MSIFDKDLVQKELSIESVRSIIINFMNNEIENITKYNFGNKNVEFYIYNKLWWFIRYHKYKGKTINEYLKEHTNYYEFDFKVDFTHYDTSSYINICFIGYDDRKMALEQAIKRSLSNNQPTETLNPDELERSLIWKVRVDLKN